MSYAKISHSGYEVIFEEPILYVDNQARKRSGHMTHGLAEFAPNCFIDFNSNCSALRWDGHMPYGWVEYRISEDGGKTYSEVKDLEYSKQCFLDGIHTISVEKAVGCDDGSIVAFCLRNSALDPSFCEPWDTPTVIRSTDGGQSWSAPVECIPYKGRIYDALYHKGVIYAAIFCNEHFLGETEDHKYRIYKSFNNGLTFEEAAVIPFETKGHGYCSIVFGPDDRLHAYAYIGMEDTVIDHAVSEDYGVTWTVLERCSVKKGIRNPQTAFLNGVFLMHARTFDNKSFVFYTSEDAASWDDGTIIASTVSVGQYYSNNIILEDEVGKFLLVQYSESYDSAKVNVKHIKARVLKTQPSL